MEMKMNWAAAADKGTTATLHLSAVPSAIRVIKCTRSCSCLPFRTFPNQIYTFNWRQKSNSVGKFRTEIYEQHNDPFISAFEYFILGLSLT